MSAVTWQPSLAEAVDYVMRLLTVRARREALEHYRKTLGAEFVNAVEVTVNAARGKAR